MKNMQMRSYEFMHQLKQNLTSSENDMSPVQSQAMIWTIAGYLLIGPSGTNFNEISKRTQ